MKDPTQDKKRALPEEGGRDDLNLTNNDASLVNQSNIQTDSPVMTDQAGGVNNENLTQSALQDGEAAPEFGDASDPTHEELGQHHRDE